MVALVEAVGLVESSVVAVEVVEIVAVDTLESAVVEVVEIVAVVGWSAVVHLELFHFY